MKKNVMILIPAYNPIETLEELVKDLKKSGYIRIIVVNDGSRNEEIFKNIEKDVLVLKHEKNKGKGRALKTGFYYCVNNEKDIIGVITVDADGQHLLKDIDNVYERLIKNPQSLIIGSRDFRKANIPLRSLIGNNIISFIFKLKTKVKIKDTQTGLRGIPSSYLADFYKIEGERFEYETNMLLYAVKQNIQILEEPIESVYLNNNKTSNFNVLKDSIEIIKRVLNRK